jgi:hypothetical protein
MMTFNDHKQIQRFPEEIFSQRARRSQSGLSPVGSFFAILALLARGILSFQEGTHTIKFYEEPKSVGFTQDASGTNLKMFE